MHINDVYAIRQILEDLHFTPKKDVARVNAAIEACNEEIKEFEERLEQQALAQEAEYYYGA
jgi:Na+/phosphate symporter